MVGDHEDYETGAAPAAHKVSHQDGGTDEISVAGLLGETAELAAHKILPAIHHVKFTAAEARAAINNIFGSDGKADVDINLDTHKLINVVDPVTDQGADTRKARNDAISTHAGLATVHQDAPALIETHRLAAGAHHAKYTDTESRAAQNPLSIPPCAFFASDDTQPYLIGEGYLKNRSTIGSRWYFAPVYLPNGVTVTKFKVYAYRDDAASVMTAYLRGKDFELGLRAMGQVSINWTTGFSSGEDITISNPVINNTSYGYFVMLNINPNDSNDDCYLTGVVVEFTG